MAAPRAEAVPAPVPSPCTSVCLLDRATGWCLGCGRTGDEIAEWPDASDARRRAIIAQLPERRARLGAR